MITLTHKAVFTGSKILASLIFDSWSLYSILKCGLRCPEPSAHMDTSMPELRLRYGQSVTRILVFMNIEIPKQLINYVSVNNRFLIARTATSTRNQTKVQYDSGSVYFEHYFDYISQDLSLSLSLVLLSLFKNITNETLWPEGGAIRQGVTSPSRGTITHDSRLFLYWKKGGSPYLKKKIFSVRYARISIFQLEGFKQPKKPKINDLIL